MNPEQLVRRRYSMQVGMLAVEEMCVRLPEPIEYVDSNRKHFEVGAVELQTTINPALTKVAVHLIRLWDKKI